MVTWRRYTADDRPVWDDFVRTARSRLFFFERAFMEYHADRFTDESLLCWDDKRLIAVLPASRHGDQLVSHGGLTYGGLILSDKARAGVVLEAFEALLAYARAAGINSLIYKAVPYIFHHQPAQEDLYALFRLGAQLIRRDISSVIYLDARGRVSTLRKRMVARARREGLQILSSGDWQGFHALLSEVLKRHDTTPAHSADELRYLAEQFPERVLLRVAEHQGEVLAATLLFVFDQVVHTQYIATSEAGKPLGALDFLLEGLIDEYAGRGFKYFSFGISTEAQGRVLNPGLIAQKEGFGARGIALDFYKVDVDGRLS